MDNRKLDKKHQPKQSDQFVKFTGLGFQWLGTFGLMGVLGYYLDNWLGTLPLFLVIFIISALIGNIYMVIKSSGK